MVLTHSITEPTIHSRPSRASARNSIKTQLSALSITLPSQVKTEQTKKTNYEICEKVCAKVCLFLLIAPRLYFI